MVVGLSLGIGSPFAVYKHQFGWILVDFKLFKLYGEGISTILPCSLVARHSGDDLANGHLEALHVGITNVAQSITMSKPAWLSMKGTSRHKMHGLVDGGLSHNHRNPNVD